MREIKFRGLSIKTDEWVYGHYVVYGRDHFIMVEEKGATFVGSFKACHKKSIGQYVGVNDKHKKEIYEGDVLKVNCYGEENHICNVTFSEGQFGVDVCPERQFSAFESGEVIGNTYQNPELIKIN